MEKGTHTCHASCNGAQMCPGASSDSPTTYGISFDEAHLAAMLFVEPARPQAHRGGMVHLLQASTWALVSAEASRRLRPLKCADHAGQGLDPPFSEMPPTLARRKSCSSACCGGERRGMWSMLCPAQWGILRRSPDERGAIHLGPTRVLRSCCAQVLNNNARRLRSSPIAT